MWGIILYSIVISTIISGYIILKNIRKEFLFLVTVSMLQLLFT